MKLPKKDLVLYRINRAKETIAEAELALQNKRLHLAENRIYYSIFYMVQALAVIHDFSTSKHTTLKGWFNKEFIFKKVLDKTIYRTYNRAFEKRQEGDYDDFVMFDKKEVEQDLKEAKVTIKRLETFIKNKIES